MNRTLAILGIVGFVVATVLYNAAFTVRQDRQAVVLRFGDPQRVIRDPGLNWKMPFVDNVVTFDRRELMRDIQHQEVTMQDQKRMLADAYVVYRIVDPLTFLRQWQTVENFELRLDAISGNILRGSLAQMQFAAMLTPQRLDFNRRVTEAVRAETRRFGVEIVDVRVTRTDVPDANAPAIFQRMVSERQREAAQERAEGAEISQRIRAEADRDRIVLVAEATRQSAVARGQGDGEATRIYAEAFNRDPQFYAFWRSLQAYRAALDGGGGTTMVLTPDSDFFRYFRDMRGSPEGGASPRPGAAPRAPAGPAPAAPAAPPASQ